MSADLLALGQRGRRSHWRSPRRALRPELSARGAEAQKRIKKKGPQCSPQTLSHCVREVGEGENDPYGRDMTATPAVFCQPRFHLPGGQRGGKGAQRPRAGRARVPRAPLAHATQARRESHRTLESQPQGRGTAAAQDRAWGRGLVLWRGAPPPGATGNRGYLGSRALSTTLALRGPRTN